MRLLFLNILFSLPYLVIGQLVLQPIEKSTRVSPLVNYFSIQNVEADSVLALPFWDDFSTSTNYPDTSLWENSTTVNINNTMSTNAPTFNVATFDGLNASGRPHDANASFNGAADSLISKRIDLSLVELPKRSSVYFSFFWQIRGKGDIPEEKDSLRLQFKRADGTWTTRWSITGGIDNVKDEFTYELIPLLIDDYFHSDFRFRFQSFNSLKGIFDSWHLDYIYLDEDRNQNNNSHRDHSLSAPITQLFNPYYEIPANHFFADPNKYLSIQATSASNLDNIVHNIVFTHEVINTINGEVLYSEQLGDSTSLIDPFEIRPIFGGDIFFNPSQVFDSTVIETTFIYHTGDAELYGTDLRINDTLREHYTLHNHYAYDDGSAEVAAGIDLFEGKLAIQFTVGEPDTLTHFQIHFPNTVPSAEGETINLTIWKNLDEDVVLHIQPYIIQTSEFNKFTEIQLSTPVIVRDTFYIGYQQFTNDLVGVGFDKNNEIAFDRIFTNTSFEWIQNQRDIGVLMMRPVFKNASDFKLGNILTRQENKLYPNPNLGSFSISGTYDEIDVLDLSGRLLFNESQRSIHTTSLVSGIYLIRIYQGDRYTAKKLIIND